MMQIAAHVLNSVVDILDKYEKIDFISLTKADQEGLLDKIPVQVALDKIPS